MPILPMLEEICHQVMGWFASCRHSEDLSSRGIVSTIGSQIQTLINERARRYRYHPSPDSMQFDIKSSVTLGEYKVNLTLQTCCCRVWQTTVLISFLNYADLKGIPLRPCPCRHSWPKEKYQRLCSAPFR